MKASRILVPIAGLALVAGLIGGSSPEEPAPAKLQPKPQPKPTGPCPPAGTSILLVGDSLAVGLYPRLEKLADGCGVEFDAHPIGGSNVSQWAAWIGADLAIWKPLVVLASIGGNDFQRTDPDKVRVAIGKFVAAVRGAGARLLWISPPTFPFADTAGVRAMWAEVPLLDTFPAEQYEIPRAGDKIHPTATGYDMLAGLIWTWASDTLSSPSSAPQSPR